MVFGLFAELREERKQVPGNVELKLRGATLVELAVQNQVFKQVVVQLLRNAAPDKNEQFVRKAFLELMQPLN